MQRFRAPAPLAGSLHLSVLADRCKNTGRGAALRSETRDEGMVRKDEADTDPQTPRGRAPDTDPGLGPGAPRVIVATQTGDADPDELLGNLAKQRTLPPKIVRSTAGQSKAAYAAVGAPAVRQDTPPPEPAVVVNDSSANEEPASHRAVVRGLAGAGATNTTVLIPGRTRPRFAIAVLVGGVVAALAAVIILAIGHKEPDAAAPSITVVPTTPTQASAPTNAAANANAGSNASATAPTMPTNAIAAAPSASAIAPNAAPIAPIASIAPAHATPATSSVAAEPTSPAATAAPSPKKPTAGAKPAASAQRELRLLPDEP